MNETYRLELNFANEFGKNRKITIRRPIAGLTETEIQPVMQNIVDKEIFSDDGVDPYGLAKNACYVRTNVEEVFAAK
ncbi:MAG: DUF2922 domain-containing protein [Atopostipes suicloacalis]|nr:DUF2922 domain-containing protein [Atopostipes suicloacalis]MDN6730996.1 DUF2922 domain-containing protein [Atopostipes suicloacalis]